LNEKRPIDQRSNEIPTHMAANPVRQILRKFGAPPKIRRLLSAGRATAGVKLFVTSLIPWTFPIKHAATPALARFLRDESKKKPVHPIADGGRKT
jgi:hypothetical protein